MAQEVRNFARFYGLLKLMPGMDKEELKEQLVESFTSGRTSSLKEMTDVEYRAMCKSLEERSGYRNELKFRRSCCLHAMQVLGINTSDWMRVNSFCLDRRIAGKKFAQLSVAELKALDVKLRMIERKGGTRVWKNGGLERCEVADIGSGGNGSAYRENNNLLTDIKQVRNYGNKTEENYCQWRVKGSC